MDAFEDMTLSKRRKLIQFRMGFKIYKLLVSSAHQQINQFLVRKQARLSTMLPPFLATMIKCSPGVNMNKLMVYFCSVTFVIQGLNFGFQCLSYTFCTLIP